MATSPKTTSTTNNGNAAPPAPPEPVAQLVDHFFRQQSTRLVAALARTYGWRHFELVEEVVQESLLAAFQCWQRHGIPREPAAWLQRIARNKIVDALRRQGAEQRASQGWCESAPTETNPTDDWNTDQAIADGELRMLLACCHPELSSENRIVLVLKILFGYSTHEAAAIMDQPEERVKKRLQRARAELRERNVPLAAPAREEAQRRMPEVAAIFKTLRDLAARLPASEAGEVLGEVQRMTDLLAAQKFILAGSA